MRGGAAVCRRFNSGPRVDLPDPDLYVQVSRDVVMVLPKDPIQPEFAMQEISRAVGRDVIVVEEAPSHRPAMQKHLPILRPKGFYTMASGGLGWGLPAAVGVALAEKQPVVCLVGDGSAMYSIQALWTAVQEKLSLVMIVLNNRGYGAMKSFGRLLGTRAICFWICSPLGAPR
jgi:benzoylformate decarboxylase